MKTISERARVRATISRLRAIQKTTPDGVRFYHVYNLNAHRKYTVSIKDGMWVCHCEGAKGLKRCKHLQRVLDREEARRKEEALQHV